MSTRVEKWELPPDIERELNFELGMRLDHVCNRIREIVDTWDRQGSVSHEQERAMAALIHARHLASAAAAVLAGVTLRDDMALLGVPSE